VALKAIEQRQNIGKRPQPTYNGGEVAQVQYLQWSLGWLARLRDEAIRAGAVERGPEKSQQIVEDFLRKLVGAEAAAAADAAAAREEEELQPGTMLVGDTVMFTPYESVTPKEEAAVEAAAWESGEPDASAREELTRLETRAERATYPADFPGSLETCPTSFGSTEDFAAEGAAADADQVASDDYEATYGDDLASEGAVCDAEKTPNGRAPTEGDDGRLSLRESPPFRGAKGDIEAQLKQARWRLDDRYGMAMSRERIASELELLDRWKRGLHRLSSPSYDQIEAMLDYCRLARIPLPKSLRRQGTGVSRHA
jgi:hypothetical protein